MKPKLSRYIISAVVICLLMASLIVKLATVTLSDTGQYASQASSKSTATVTLKGARGSIMDRNGVVLAYDKTCYDVQFLRDANNRTSYYSAVYTEALIKAIGIIEDGGGTIIDSSYIRRDESGNFYYDWGVTSERAIMSRYKSFCDVMGFSIPSEHADDMSYWISAEDAYISLRKSWYIPEELSYEDANKIISIRQMVNLNNYRAYEPVTIATDVSAEVVAKIEMMKDELPGLQTTQSTTRVYPYGETAAHVVGYTQKAVTEDMLSLGYSYSDFVGVAGIESTMEEYLTGATTEKQGYRLIEVNRNLAEVSEIEVVAASNGDDVMLTIDIAYQRVVEQALADIIAEINATETALIEENPDRYGEYDDIELAQTGAIVMMDANSGDILAMASYPSYDPNWFISGLTDEQAEYMFSGEEAATLTPTLNKAISLKRAPGSIFKMVTGLAGVMEGAITLDETVDCVDRYVLTDESGNPIERDAPSCHTSYPSSHADQNLRLALTNSCNTYFYEVSNRLGIDKLASWAEQLGLSDRTGIQLTGEITGQIGGQTTLFDYSEIDFDNLSNPLATQRASLPSYIYGSLKSKLQAYLSFCGKTAESDDISTCALELMELQDGSLDNKGGDVRRILSDVLGIPEGVTKGQPWVSEIMSMLNELQWKPTLTIRTGIGQAVSAVTPVAVARYVATIANGGTVYNANIVSRVVDEYGSVVVEYEPSVFNVIDAPDEYWEAIHAGLQGVVSPEDRGTAANRFSQEFRDKGYLDLLSGKTGSAQVGNNPIDIENTSWFVSYAPRDNPEIVLVVCIPNGYSGSSSAPAIEDIITYYFDKQIASVPDSLVPVNGLTP
ncbi:MAG: penicillin-binding transpeptidase domain-containing protein [Clostridia bacterium]|nr:penicillin-binding transpeptidase domain-containing protein [Clostridia bacterium]